MLPLVRKLDTFRGEAALPTWLHRVTVNAAITHWARRARLMMRDALAPYYEEG